MNHILELCKIFHCHMNDLVNDSIIDMDSLDEEIKMNVVKFKKEQQSKMKGLSKALSIIAKIGRIVCIVCLPIIITTMIILGICINKAEVNNNEIVWNGNDTISVIETDNKLSIMINDTTFADMENQTEIIKIKEILKNNSKMMILGCVETGFAILIIGLILIIIMLKSLENLFNNINKGDTPFALENVSYIKKMAYLMIAITILPDAVGLIFEVILKIDLDIGFEMFSLIEILFLFSIAYIFQYGYEIQLDSKGKMYGNENE